MSCINILIVLFIPHMSTIKRKKSKELPAVQQQQAPATATVQQQSRENGGRTLARQQELSANCRSSAMAATPWRWKEKEAEMHSLQGRLTEREREIGRLKEKLRELTKKLQQEQMYNSKVIRQAEAGRCPAKFKALQWNNKRRRLFSKWNGPFGINVIFSPERAALSFRAGSCL